MPVKICCGNRKSALPAGVLLKPKLEAEALMPLLQNGESIEMIRQLIGISDAEQHCLRKIEQNPAALRAIRDRAAILREFDVLISRHLKADGRRCP